MIEVSEQHLWDHLAAKPPEKLYLVADAAMHTHIYPHIEAWQPPSIQLQAEGAEIPAEAAPWLVEMKPMNTFCSWFLQEGFFAGWGILLHSNQPILRLAEQLQGFLVGWEPDKKEKLLLRFYDPQIIYGFMSVLNDQERITFLHGCSSIWRPTGVEQSVERITWEDGGLKRTDFMLDAAAQEIASKEAPIDA